MPLVKIINRDSWRTLGTRRSLAVQRLPMLVAIPAWLVALDAGIAQMQGMLHTHKLGLDFAPSYGAGQAVLNHRSIGLRIFRLCSLLLRCSSSFARHVAAGD
jgi:hypothetical protein